MWDSLPWFVQLAIAIGSALFLWTVAMEAILRTMKLVAVLTGLPVSELKAIEKRLKAEE